MSSLIGKEAGIFNPALRFAFTNITTDDLVSAWDGSPITVKPGQTVELSHHLANKLTDELVDKIMIGAAKLDETTKNQPYYRSPMGSSLGVPGARKVWEDQIVRPLAVDEESPEIQIIRSQIKAELEADMAKEPGGSVSDIQMNPAEFAELGGTIGEVAQEKKPLKVKTLKG